MRIVILFLWAVTTFAQTQNPIELAQEKALAKQRKEACSILIAAAESAKSPSKQRIKIIESLDAISTAFFTDKGQKLFQSAQSLLYESTDVAISTLKEANATEDQNVSVSLALARAYILKKDFSNANAALLLAKAMHPYSMDVRVLQLKILTLEQKFDLVREELRTLPVPIEKSQELFVKQVIAQDYLEQQLSQKSFETLQKITEMDNHFPEPYFWLTRAGHSLGKDTEEWARKYVSLCKNVDAKTRRKYANEPSLCSHVKEVEDELAQKSSET